MIGSESPCNIKALIRTELSCRLPQLSISTWGLRVASASNDLFQQKNSSQKFHASPITPGLFKAAPDP